MPSLPEGRGIGRPDQLRDHLQAFSDVGVDQVIFIQQAGRNRHEHICESLELFASQVMPVFKEGEVERERSKREALAPWVEKAMERKTFMKALSDDEIPPVQAYGRTITDPATGSSTTQPPAPGAGGGAGRS
jgi:hypothetical protein